MSYQDVTPNLSDELEAELVRLRLQVADAQSLVQGWCAIYDKLVALAELLRHGPPVDDAGPVADRARAECGRLILAALTGPVS